MALRPSWLAAPRPRVISFLVLLAGILLNSIFYTAALHDHRDRSADHFAADAAELVDVINTAIHHGSDRLVAVQGLFEASREVTESEFQLFIDRLGPGEGLASIGFAPLVRTEGLPAFTADMQEQDPGYDVYELDAAGNRVAVQPRAEHFPVTAERDFGNLPLIVGFDLASEPARAAAIAAALGASEPVLTDFVDLPGDDQPGDVKIIAPVHNAAGLLVGVTFASMQVDELLDVTAAGGLDQPVTWQMADVTGGDVAGVVPVREETRWADVLDIHGRQWLLTVETGVDHLAQDASRNRLLLLMGLAATVLAAILGYVLTKSRGARRELRQIRDLVGAKDRFLAGVSHEIRTPLTGVLGMTGVLAKEWRSLPADEVQDLLDIVEDQGAELADRVDDLLTIGNITSGTLTVRADRVDLGPEIEHVTSRIVVPPGKEVRESGVRGTVVGDRLRIRQILRNLYTNALRYADHSVQIVTHPEGDRLQICICNDGPPLAEEKQRRVFQPYLEDRRPGQPATIGAGLWISRTLAEAMGGALTYRYREGRSVFTLELPGYPRPEPAAPEPTSEAAVPVP